MNARRPGIAFVLAIIVLLVIEAMSAGMLALATSSRVVVDSRLRTAQADAAAHSAVQSVIRNWAAARFDTLSLRSVVGVPSSPPISGTVVAVFVERLDVATWLVRAKSRAGDGRAYSLGRAVAVARTLDTTTARIENPTDSLPVGGLNWTQLREIADRIAPSRVIFADSATDAALTYADSDLVISSGYGRGILVVNGNLTILSDAVFEGLIVAGKDVDVENGAFIIGKVRSVSGTVRGDGTGIEDDPGAVQAVLSATPARLKVVSEVRRFIPAF